MNNGTHIKNGVIYSGGANEADQIAYDNTASGLEATNTQEAIDEINSDLTALGDKVYGRDYVEVVSTGGSTTTRSMLVTLGNLIDFSKISFNSVLEIYIPSNATVIIFQMSTYNANSNYIVVNNASDGSNGETSNTITCSASTSSAGNGWTRTNALTTGTAVQDLSTAAQASGIRFRLYY